MSSHIKVQYLIDAAAQFSLTLLSPEFWSRRRAASSFTSTEHPVHPHAATHRLAVANILNRAPIVTPWGPPFERAYFKYQARIARALSNPFPYDFYFKPGSLLAAKFLREEKTRDQMAFGHEYMIRERKVMRAADAEEDEDENLDPTHVEEKPASRTSEADRKGDVHSLDRNGARNVYLLLKRKSGVWTFPTSVVEDSEMMHEAAQRTLDTLCGTGMDTWIVARQPIGFRDLPLEAPVGQYVADKVFFLKSHMLCGQVHISPDQHQDFAWLTKDEIQGRVNPQYWDGVKAMLSDL